MNPWTFSYCGVVVSLERGRTSNIFSKKIVRKTEKGIFILFLWEIENGKMTCFDFLYGGLNFVFFCGGVRRNGS